MTTKENFKLFSRENLRKVSSICHQRIFLCLRKATYFPEKPQIIDIYTSSDSTVEEDDRVQLDCNAGGIPKPKISWQMAGGGILPTGGRILQVSSDTVFDLITAQCA